MTKYSGGGVYWVEYEDGDTEEMQEQVPRPHPTHPFTPLRLGLSPDRAPPLVLPDRRVHAVAHRTSHIALRTGAPRVFVPD